MGKKKNRPSFEECEEKNIFPSQPLPSQGHVNRKLLLYTLSTFVTRKFMP